MASQLAVVQQQPQKGLLASMAEKYNLDPDIFERTIAATCMPAQHTREEFVACMMIAHQHNLNPLTKEIYFMRTRSGQIQPIVGMDGWITLAQRNTEFKGYTFREILDPKTGNVLACEGTFRRKDWDEPLVITEYMAECRGSGGGWQKTPIRMLRNRTLTQGIRLLVGISGLMERDEYDQWQDRELPVAQAQAQAPAMPSVDELFEEPAAPPDPDAPQTDAEFLADLKEALRKNAGDVVRMGMVWDAFRDEISDRGLQQEAHDLRDALDPDKEPDTNEHTSAETTAERVVDTLAQPDKSPARLSSAAAAIAIRSLTMRMQQVHNLARLKTQWQGFAEVYRTMAPEDQARADTAYAERKQQIEEARK